ncbi:FecR family protein [Chitinophaga costaii]|uniref:FecR family protein n=1 Tax=Chitinophaga costaii TaxID=1335309 RepID=A0A1C3ZFX2_9BACT|nr:FecR family protein [Chitinophaga costaii]PUZ30356.1 DUF4974 domain-containing protein [Chitinophaga costaii]SCB81285.1 FecR family protein [Chitinophaga costaii]
MDTEQIKALLARYQDNACTPAETQVVEQWFDSINSHRTQVIQEAPLQAQLDEVKMQLQYILPAPTHGVRKVWTIAVASMAASLLLLAFFYKQSAPPSPAEAVVAAAPIVIPAHSNRVVENGYMIITTGKGSTEQVALADGSTVTVNASSRIRYPLKFPDNKREVYLEEGEAYFNVAKDAARAFRVVSGSLVTTALGTSFNIRAYRQENHITVSLLTGKVKIDGAANRLNQPIVLLPSERLDYDCRSTAGQKNFFTKPEEIIGWKQGFLVFKDASFKEVAIEIGNRYGVTIVNQSCQQEWDYTGFFKDESLQEVIETICISKNINYNISNDTVYFKN